jgi:hypothetical protein
MKKLFLQIIYLKQGKVVMSKVTADSWSTTSKPKKPRKKPVAKRTPVPKPEGLTPLEEAVYNYLVRRYPTPANCEDILAGVRLEEELKIKQIWDVMDEGPISKIVHVPQWSHYVINAE